GGNYTVTPVSNTSGVINPRALTVTAATNTKTYDGTTGATATPTITSGSLQGSDTANFTESYDTKNAGTGKLLTPSGTVSDGNGGNNYTYSFVTSNPGVINKVALTFTAAPYTKTYDATTIAAGPFPSVGLWGTDTVTILTETYDNKNAGTGKTLSVATYRVN